MLVKGGPGGRKQKWFILTTNCHSKSQLQTAGRQTESDTKTTLRFATVFWCFNTLRNIPDVVCGEYYTLHTTPQRKWSHVNQHSLRPCDVVVLRISFHQQNTGLFNKKDKSCYNYLTNDSTCKRLKDTTTLTGSGRPWPLLEIGSELT